MRQLGFIEMQPPKDTEGPYIVWENYGCEGWKPTSFHSIDAALIYHKYNSEWIITKNVAWEVKEKEND